MKSDAQDRPRTLPSCGGVSLALLASVLTLAAPVGPSRADGPGHEALVFVGVDSDRPIDLVADESPSTTEGSGRRPAHAAGDSGDEDEDEDQLVYRGGGVRVRILGAIEVLRDDRVLTPRGGGVSLRTGDRIRARAGAADAGSTRAALETIPSGHTPASRADFRIHSRSAQDVEGHDARARGVCIAAPRERPAPAGSAPDPSRIRLALGREAGEAACALEVRVTDAGGVPRSARSVDCGPSADEAVVDLRVVANEASPGVGHDGAPGVVPVVARLGDTVEARFVHTNGPVVVRARVGTTTGPCAPLRVRLALHVVRADVDALSPAGATRAAVRANTSAAIAHAREAYSACGIDPVDAADLAPSEAKAIDEAPPPWVLAVAEGDGLPARGGGAIHFLADGRAVGPVVTRAGARPSETADTIALALRRLGFDATVIVLPRLDRAADGAADVLVRDSRGALVRLEPLPETPLSTDGRQRLAIGAVDFADGLDEFDLDRSRVGTLEERTLVYAYRDADPRTVDVFFVERFRGAARQGEAFVPRDRGPLAATVIVGRLGLFHDGATYTLAHELGHVLLDDPFHPGANDDAASARVMGADSGRRDVRVVREFTAEECDRMRFAGAALLEPIGP